MNKTTSLQMPRRKFLRGLGTLVALPALNSLCPTSAFGATADGASKFPKRVAWVYIPNGANMADWTPATTGADYEMPMILQPLGSIVNNSRSSLACKIRWATHWATAAAGTPGRRLPF